MSSRALRKLQGEQEIVITGLENDLSDEEKSSLPSVRKKKKNNINPFVLLDQTEDDQGDGGDSDQPSDQDKVGEGEVLTKVNKQKKKKKKKRKGARDIVDTSQPGQDDIDASIEAVNALLGELPSNQSVDCHDDDLLCALDTKAILNVEHKHLNAENEMKRIFGSRVVQSQQSRSRRPARRTRQTWLVQPREGWRPMTKVGLSMAAQESKKGCQYFKFEHNKEYQKVQFQFLDAVESFNPENIMAVLNTCPYHIDSLIQLSEVCRMSEDIQMATELIERALYTFESNFHTLFSLTQGNCRLDYRYAENRSFYLALFKHLSFIGQRGCYRTALEFCKLLLSLDPDDDPLCALLMIDFYALRSSEYAFLVRLFQEWEAHRSLSQLPNFAFSVPLAMYQLSTASDQSTERADVMLQNSLLMFPGLLIPLLDKCSVSPDPQVASHALFGTKAQLQQPSAVRQLIALYVGRCHSVWKEPGVVSWLEKNVRQVVDRVDKGDKLSEEYAAKCQVRYQGTPRNIFRHILLSEVKDATAALPPELSNTPVLSYDPLPPKDSIQTYTRPARPTRLQQDSSVMSTFFRSLLPNFNPQEEPLREDVEGAVGGNQGNQLQAGVNALMAAMRDLLSNIQMEAPPVENRDDEAEEEWD